MMYNLLGRLVWMVATRFTKRKVGQNRVKVGAAAVVLLVLLGGVAAAKAGSDSD